jgi:anthranilate phosphoribosyltransferase
MDSLNLLLEQQDLTFEQANSFFDLVMQGEVSEIELTAALIALKIKKETGFTCLFAPL